MLKYKVEFNKKYLKELEKIPVRARNQIRESILHLAHNPRPDGCKKLQGNTDPPLYRIRCGDYRVIYTIRDDFLLVLVVEVGHRRDIYR